MFIRDSLGGSLLACAFNSPHAPQDLSGRATEVPHLHLVIFADIGLQVCSLGNVTHRKVPNPASFPRWAKASDARPRAECSRIRSATLVRFQRMGLPDIETGKRGAPGVFSFARRSGDRIPSAFEWSIDGTGFPSPTRLVCQCQATHLDQAGGEPLGCGFDTRALARDAADLPVVL